MAIQQQTYHGRFIGTSSDAYPLLARAGDELLHTDTNTVYMLKPDGTWIIIGYGDGSGCCPAPDVFYDNVDYPNVDVALDYLFGRLGPDPVTLLAGSLSVTPSQAEKGSTVTNLDFDWSLNKDCINGSINTTVYELLAGDLTATSHTTTVTGLTVTNDTTYTLTAATVDETITPSATLLFLNKRYWGTYPATTIDDVGILSLLSEFASDYVKTYTIADGGGKYLYYCIPASWGIPIFYIGGFRTGLVMVTQNFINSSGYTESYNIFRSSYPQNGGNIKIEIQAP